MVLSHRFLRKRGRRLIRELLAHVGVQIDGHRPFDVHVLNDAFYDEAVPRGVEGLLDGYVEGWWESDRLDELAAKVLAGGFRLPESGGISHLWDEFSARLINRQGRSRSRHVACHYDLGNDLFAAMLDRRMVYSCGYWKQATDLYAAQEAKLDLIVRKVGLRRPMRVLDIGCGWGSFAKYAAETRGVSVVGITISEQQIELGRSCCAGLPVDLHLADYREFDDGVFDAVVSVGMFEHVGYKNYRTFMKVVRRCLKPDGLFLLHTIGTEKSRVGTHPWIERNIFPGAMLPSAQQITAAADGLFVIEDWHNFGPDYDKTLLTWFANFDAAWPDLREQYGERFYRMWKCYLLTEAGAFRARENHLWQIVLSPHGVPGGYSTVR